MPTAWFICKYKRRTIPPNTWWKLMRYCAMDDFTPQIRADGGTWAEAEILNGYAVVKVSASDATLNAIAGTTGFQRLPKTLLTASLSDLTTAQKNAIRNKLEEIGYSLTGKWPARGLSASTGSAGNPLTVVTGGLVRNDGWAFGGGTAADARNQSLYLSTVAGGLSTAAPTASGACIQVVGFCLSDDEAFFNFTGVYAEK